MARDDTALDHETAFQNSIDREIQRLEFVRQRDGVDAMHEFARRTRQLYGNAINAGPTKPSMATCREHRYKFIASIFTYEVFLGIPHTPPMESI